MDIGIIGGADGPTAIFVASHAVLPAIAAAAIVCIAVVVAVRRAKKRKR